MLWWDEGLCRTLAGAGRFVIRYDHRDTGRSITYEPGHPGYIGADLLTDAAGVLAAYGIASAHVVGVSAGGAFAQLLPLEFPDRVRSLVLISTTAATPGDGELPTPTDQFRRFLSTATVDWSDRDSVVEYVVGYSRLLAGARRPFDAAQMHDLVRGDVERAVDFAARRNHDLLTEGESPSAPVSEISAPTLVIHGTADPMFRGHGEALAHEIPDARLLDCAAPATESTLQTGRRSPPRSSTIPAQPIPPDERESCFVCTKRSDDGALGSCFLRDH
jgi:pimeloyl-ACP methyl ester carboxylesterase